MRSHTPHITWRLRYFDSAPRSKITANNYITIMRPPSHARMVSQQGNVEVSEREAAAATTLDAH